MMALLRAEGFIHGDIGPDDVLAYIGALADPLRVPRFRFDRAWMAAQGARVADLRGAAYRETGPGADPARRTTSCSCAC